ncbi:MAG: aldehyde dehydrogenase family protein [Bacteriovoracaceae bacterium]|jgi:acyl-CoA reductase-like NAD-dependent aldehyde dehydrogenase|nr:aldehyde dehydrogenase family protein [Bacteriovoracaceae bacterium]
MDRYKSLVRNSSLIHNKFCEGKQSTFDVLDKFDQSIIETVSYLDCYQMEVAIESAVEGFNSLRSLNTGERRDCLQTLQKLLGERAEEFAFLICAEAGKPIEYARAEVLRTISTLDHAIDLSRTFSGEQIPMDFDGGVGKQAFTRRFPVGPIAAISPFNFPLNLVMHKLAPALAVGCSVLLKPSPLTPFSALALAELVREVGFPDGSFNVVLAEDHIAQKMIEDGRLKLLSFTGSAYVGWKLKALSKNKKCILELGGDAAVLVDESADLEKITPQIVKGAYMYAGQICISTQRIFCVSSIYSKFKKLLINEIKKLKIGNPLIEENEVGPMINSFHLDRISSWIDEAESLGADCLVGGAVFDMEHNIYRPTLLENVPRNCKLGHEEVFGPVAIIEEVKNFEQGLTKINQSSYGLQTGIFTENINRMKLAFETIEAGAVLIGMIPGFRIDHMPYGGIKNSGLGREGIKYAMEDMTEPKLLIF